MFTIDKKKMNPVAKSLKGSPLKLRES